MSRYKLFFSLLMLQLFATDVFAVASCQSGYSVVSNVAESTFVSPVNGLCQIGGYSLKEIPDEFAPIYNGFLMGGTKTLCEDGYLTGGSCVSFTQGSCMNGTYNIGITESTFVSPVNGLCQIGGYSLLLLPDDFDPSYNGFLMGPEVTLCTNGYKSGNSCVSYASGDCINGYYDLSINANTFANLTNDACSSPYANFKKTTLCDHNPGDTCVDLPTPVVSLTWSDGENTVSTNTCVYEGNIVLPETPSKPGYTFAGWKLERK